MAKLKIGIIALIVIIIMGCLDPTSFNYEYEKETNTETVIETENSEKETNAETVIETENSENKNKEENKEQENSENKEENSLYNYLKIYEKTELNNSNGFFLSPSNNSEFDGVWESETGEMFQFISRSSIKYWDSSNKNGERESTNILYKAPPTYEGSLIEYYRNDKYEPILVLRLNNMSYVISTRYNFLNCNSSINGYSKELRLGENYEVRFIKRILNNTPIFDY